MTTDKIMMKKEDATVVEKMIGRMNDVVQRVSHPKNFIIISMLKMGEYLNLKEGVIAVGRENVDING